MRKEIKESKEEMLGKDEMRQVILNTLGLLGHEKLWGWGRETKQEENNFWVALN